MNYYISDMHWGQEDVIGYDNRPFANANECYTYMRKVWNQTVQPEDHVYIVGDCLSRQISDIRAYLGGLNGRLHLVVGNHDINLVKHTDLFCYFDEVAPIIEVTDGEYTVVMCHYPMLCWPHKNNKSCIHIFGHVHKNYIEETKYINHNGIAYNAGCMINGYRPVTLQELSENFARFITD